MTDPANRAAAIIAGAVAALDPADVAERIAYCRRHDRHGVTMHPGDDGVVEFRWGGRRLALVAAADLDSDVPLAGGFVPDDLSPPDSC